MHRRHRTRDLFAALAVGVAVLGTPGAQPGGPGTARAATAFADPYFRESDVFTGLTKPTTVRFADDGRVFVAEKAGIIKEFDSLADTTPTTVVDISGEVNSYWDRGLLGMTLDPQFTTGRPYLYAFFVYDAPPGQTAPVWNDLCPSPPGSLADGCPVTSKLVRFTIVPGNVATGRLELIHDWCQQFPSHSGGGLAFGPDGYLYVTGGDGASFTATDFGQFGGTLPNPAAPVTPVDPCGDPVTMLAPLPNGNPQVDVATAEGGSLRAQDVRTTGDPTGLSGSLIRVDPDTGAAAPTNPLIASADANTRRIEAFGLRNPFRIAFRPGTSDLYVGDVGQNTWEEVDRVPTGASPATPPNYGWPCYEGFGQSFWSAVGNNLCNSLYASGNVVAPVYAYSHTSTLTPTGPCFAPDGSGAESSSITGVAFYAGASGQSTPYPSRLDGALFFADYSRNCIAAMLPGANGAPDPTKVEDFETGASGPVDLVTGPGGDLYYVALGDQASNGRVVRIKYVAAPVAHATATPSLGHAPLDVTLDGTASFDPNPTASIATWLWDMDNDGVFTGPNDLSGSVVHHTFDTPATYPITLKVTSTNGLSDTFPLSVTVGNDPPVPVIDTPLSTLTWKVGDTISFTGHATDPQDGTIPATSLTWDVLVEHCPSNCHEHLIETVGAVVSGSFPAPDHSYPSYLRLRLTATDSNGASASTTVDLQPQTTTIGLTSVPAGVPILVNEDTFTTPSTATVILGGQETVSAPASATVGGRAWRFDHWTDGAPRSRTVNATGPSSLAAVYVADAPDACAGASAASPQGSWIADTVGAPTDQDWYKFTLTTARRVIVTLGSLPVDARLDLYGSCSTLLASSQHAGTRFEQIVTKLPVGTYRVRVTPVGPVSSDQPYVVRFRPLASGFVLTSTHVTLNGSRTRIAGEVIDNAGTARGHVKVTATFRRGSKVVGTASAYVFARRLADGTTSPFVISATVPAWTSVSYAVTGGVAPSVPSLSLVSLVSTPGAGGTARLNGTVRNAGSSVATSVAAAVEWYGARGEVLDVAVAAVSPSRLAHLASGAFTIAQPSLPTLQVLRTLLRAY